MSVPLGPSFRPSANAGVQLSALAAQAGAVLADSPGGRTTAPDVPVTGVTLRAQDVLAGDLFAALPGSATHGARYAGEAIERGAVAVLTDAAGVAELAAVAGSGTARVPILVHPAPRSVLGGLAATVYGNPSEKVSVIGITGTSGKTTTTYLVESGLRAAGRIAGLIGTIGIRIDGTDIPSALTTPEAPDLQAMLAAMAERGVDTVVMEVSSHALTLGRVDGTGFAVGAFTNLSRDHLDFHPTMADYFDAKALLFDPESPLRARRIVVCVDDDAGRAMAERAGDAVTVSATDQPADWRAVEVGADGRRGTAVRRRRPRRRAPPGRHPAAGRLQRRQLPCRTGDPRHDRGVSGAGGARPAGRPGCPGGWNRSTAARIFLRWSTTPTSRARCGRC